MAILNEDSLTFLRNSRDVASFPINNTVVGKLTSSSDTVDEYRVAAVRQDDTLVKIKFSVDQVVTDYDYYQLETPAGNFFIHPSYSVGIKDGITINFPGGTGAYFDINVRGTNQGVFRGNYSLEITEIDKVEGVTYANTLNQSLTSAQAVPLNGKIEGWDTNSFVTAMSDGEVLRGYNGTHFYSFTVPEAEKGNFLITFTEDSQFFYVPESSKIFIEGFNEGGRSLGFSDIVKGKTVTMSNLTPGTYSFSVDSNTYAPFKYILKTEFQSTVPKPDPIETPGTSVPVNNVPAKENASSSLDVIVSLFGNVFYLKGLIEIKADNLHTVEYNGQIFNFADVDLFVTTVVRDGEFTDEFAKEVADAYPEVTGISYTTAVTLVGASAIEGVLITVAGADGNYVG